MVKNLILNLKNEYFQEIKSGVKKEEYRLCNPYWTKRLAGKNFSKVIIKLGYPKKDDKDKEIIFPWNGYKIKTISHKHFGSTPVKVFAIKLIKEEGLIYEKNNNT